MNAIIETLKTLGRPVYEATIRNGPEVLWTDTFKADFVALAITQRKLAAMRAAQVSA